ncbi:hypothetical protein BDW59DRAFT_44960 [Aspergillus cavernicola]|uniref:Uncharacterized protein n=1 Tax=Aspergillus cavernicola TaxID=176166 RepID=A0ABR4J2E6_9EURO
MSQNPPHASKRPESPAKPPLPNRVDQNVNPKTTDPQNVRSASRPSSRAAAGPPLKTNVPLRQQGPAQKPGAHPPRELPQGPKPMNSEKGKKPLSAAEDIKRLQEHVSQLETEQKAKQRIQDLEQLLVKEREMYNEVASDRDRAVAQAEENRKLWKRTAGELRRAKQAPALYQVTDSHLIGLIQQLRYSIRDFAVQYFTGIRQPMIPGDSIKIWNSCMVPTTPGTQAFREYIRSPSRCSSIIQGMLWKLLVTYVFGEFVWAGKAGESLGKLRYYLKYASHNEATPDPDVERKFQMWSAEATGLLLQMCDFSPGSPEHKFIQSTLGEIREDFWSIAEQFLSTRSRGPHQDFRRILESAISLDKEIHRQAARIKFEFPSEDTQLRFDSSRMEAEKGEQRPKPDQPVFLVVAPAVTKRGKSDGNDFDADVQLLVPVEVSCQPPSDLPGAEAESWYSHWGPKT